MTEPEPTQKRNIFRPAALESLSNSKRFEECLQVMHYRKWWTRLGLACLGIGFLVWLIWGSIPIEAQGVGVAVNEEGLYSLDTSFSGFVRYLNSNVAKEVQEGELLVVLDNPELNARQEAFQQTIANLEKRLEHLRHEIYLEKKDVIESLAKGIQAAEFKKHTLEQDIPILEEDVRLKKIVATKGLLRTNSLQESQELLWGKQIDLEKTKSDLLNLDFLLKKEYRDQEVIILEERLRDVVKEKALVEAQLQYNHIYSPIHGKILEWFVQPSNYVASGQLLARLEFMDHPSSYKVFYGYLPLEDKKITLQAPVQIELTNIKSQEYGAILGHITHISSHAASPETLQHMIHNPALIDYLLQKKTAVFEVVIEPEHDPHTPSGYRWTSGQGPDIQLSSGTLCIFKGLIEEVRPLFYFFPIWWVKQKMYELNSLFLPSSNENPEIE